MDGAYSLRMALWKRREYGLDTFAFFIDLVKAFDTVPRSALWQVLRKFGLPEHVVRVIILLYKDIKIKVTVEEVSCLVDCTLGVKQGCPLSPILFLFYVQACVETLELPEDIKIIKFATFNDGIMRGRSSGLKRGVTIFEFWKSFYADDGAFLFVSRKDIIGGGNAIFYHFVADGMHIHLGRNGGKSKSEAMYIPAFDTSPDELKLLTADFIIADGYVSFTDNFKYLGIIIPSSLNDSLTIEARINAASCAFAASGWIFESRYVDLNVNVTLFQALIQTILLYGSEIWIIKAADFRRLQTFYNHCIRKMYNLSWIKMWKQRISQSFIENKLGIKSIKELIVQRQLSYAGHVFRMDWKTRLPRMFISSSINDAKRRRGGQYKSYGAVITDALSYRGLDIDALSYNNKRGWQYIRCAQRHEWRLFTRGEILDRGINFTTATWDTVPA